MEEQLWNACSNGKVGKVQKLLQNEQININWQNQNDYLTTPFYVACQNGHIDIVKLLLNDKRIDINKANKFDETPFYSACEKGHIEIVKLLLNDKRIDINKTGNDNTTPFYIACYNRHTDIVKLLLNDQRVDFNKSNKHGWTPFYIACEKEHIDIVKLLLNNNRVDFNKANKHGWTPFLIACYDGQIDIVKLLLNDNRVDINKAEKGGSTPFLIVCYDGDIEIVKLLLNDNRVDINIVNNSGWTPFSIACYYEKTEVVKYLLESGREIDINKKDNKYGKTGLDCAKQKGNTDIVKLIESFQKHPIYKIQMEFWEACSDGKVEVVRLLQKSQININQVSNDQTPFHIACENGHIEIVKLLLNNERVEINKKNNEGKTGLDCAKGNTNVIELIESFQNNPIYKIQMQFWEACSDGKVEEVRKLLQNPQININLVSNGETPFYVACINGHIEIVKLLFKEKRLDINKTANDGWTPFYIACQKGNMEIVKSLLNEKRISIRKKSNLGKTAFDIARTNNHSEVMKLIKEFDTEQRYQEYLETFQNFSFFCIENETINKQDFLVLNEHLKKNKKIRELRLTNCDLTPSNILEILKTLIWKYENLELSNVQNIEIDNIELESTEGLEIIPIEIRNKGTRSIVQYILDLCKSPNSNPLYRTKLMVVGYENVGKTTILDCLFPIRDFGETKGKLVRNEYLIELQGKYFRRYKPKELNKVYKEISLENKQWNVQEIKETGLELIPLNDKNQKKIEINFKHQETRNKWVERLKRVILNSATHGIEVNNHIWNYSTFNQLQNKDLEAKQNENTNGNQNERKDKDDYVEFSTWDFAGQNDYYNTHHYFLSNRSIFLVLYRMDKGIKGLESLDFWLKSLLSHLNQNYCDDNGKPFYSIIIIGTFLDSIVNDNQNDEDKNLRQMKIMEIYDKNGLKSPPFYFEVSCSTLTNIEELKEIIFNISLSHSYMGEIVPIGYLSIEKSIYELRKLNQNHPIIKIQDLVDYVQSQYQSSFDIEFVKRGLRLLHEWGICIYFDKPKKISNIVVLDPQHFTKNILGDLFKADESIRQLRLNGIIDYSQLNNIWNGPTNLIDAYLSLLQKFEVCFILKDQQNENGNENENQPEKKLIIPNLLSEDKTKTIEDKLEKKWPITIPRGEIEIERIFSFNQVPSEMVSRLLVRFHDKIVDNIIWRRGVLLKHFDEKNENENENVLCLLEVKMDENLFEIRIRGKERKECLKMMKYIYEEVKIVSGNYGGVKWKECVRSPHFSKGLIDLDEVIEDCKLKLKDRKLKCPITHFPIYGEDLLFKTGLLDSLGNRNNIGNNYWNYSYENQNQNQNQESQKSETESIFENSQKLNEKEYEKVEYLLNLFGFGISRVDKIIGIENKNWKKGFEIRGQQIYGQHKDTPDLFKKEDWIEQSEPELRKSIIQYLGDYLSKFRKIGWNHGNNSFVIPMIQGTTEDAAWRICDNGFGTVCKIDAGFYAQGVYMTSKAEYAGKYCQKNPKVFVIGFVLIGNPFPVIEHPFQAQKNYNGKPINPGYQSHFTLVDERDINSAFPITKVEQLDEKWIADELVVHESQTYPSYIVYYK